MSDENENKTDTGADTVDTHTETKAPTPKKKRGRPSKKAAAVKDTTEPTTERPDGKPVEKIDWKSRIPDEEIVLNRDIFKKRGINVDSLSPEELVELKADAADNELLIKLNGFKEVLRERGYLYSGCDVIESSSSRVVVRQTITLEPNEENPRGLTVEAVANATLDNVKGTVFQSYLETIAQNRAFSRAVKDALGINILGQDEIAMQENPIVIEQESGSSVYAALQQTMDKKGVTWNQLKSTLQSKTNEYPDAPEWNSLESIPKSTVLVIWKEISALPDKG